MTCGLAYTTTTSKRKTDPKAMQEQNSEFLVFDHVTKRFGALTAVNDVSFSVGKGEFFSLLGP